MSIGFGLLRLSPKDFWAMTPREFAAAMRPAVPPAVRLQRTELEAMMRMFPDATARMR